MEIIIEEEDWELQALLKEENEHQFYVEYTEMVAKFGQLSVRTDDNADTDAAERFANMDTIVEQKWDMQSLREAAFNHQCYAEAYNEMCAKYQQLSLGPDGNNDTDEFSTKAERFSRQFFYIFKCNILIY